MINTNDTVKFAVLDLGNFQENATKDKLPQKENNKMKGVVTQDEKKVNISGDDEERKIIENLILSTLNSDGMVR